MERPLSNKNNFNKQYQRNAISRLLRISNRNRDADEGIVYEVVHSEDAESIEKKKVLYPLEVRVVYADQEFTPKLLL